MGQKQKTEKKEREKERKRERAKVGENNGQARHGARKHAWRTQARMKHASTHGARKPPGPIEPLPDYLGR